MNHFKGNQFDWIILDMPPNHFDNLDYDNELPEHITKYFVERKCRKILRVLNKHHRPDSSFISKMMGFDRGAPIQFAEKISGLDLGCGAGHHTRWLNRQFLHIDGVDKVAHKFNSLHGDICDMLFVKSETFDFAYTINVLHHIEDKHDQIRAMREASRILRRGGLFIIMEMNFLNPLIALYVKYLFKKFRVIDQGAENWFDPDLLNHVGGFKLIKTEYFTFTPDFCPRWLLPLFRRIDEWADGKWFSKYGAHVMYVLEKI